MSKRDKIIFILIAFILILASVGITYAFFSSLSNSESSSTIFAKGGSMSIKYANGSGNITMQNIYPRANAWVNKTFTVTGNNTTDLDMYYGISLIVDNNEYGNLLSYTLTGTNTSNNGTLIPNITTNESIDSSEIELGIGKFGKGTNVVHTYQLSIYFKENNENQNFAQEAQFAAHLIINNANETGIANYSGSGRNLNIIGNESKTKTFKVESGSSESAYDYDIYLAVDENSEYGDSNYKYTLTGTNISSSGTVANVTSTDLPVGTSIKLGSGSFTKTNTIHSYTLKIGYENLVRTSTSNTDLLKTKSAELSGKIFIIKHTSLKDTLIASATNAPKTTPGKDSATTNEGLNTTTDDYGTSYYYRGAVENNYVSFAGMCWRIVRITGNGAIKLVLYNNDSPSCTQENTNQAFLRLNSETSPTVLRKSWSGSAETIAYMYGSDGTIKTPLAYNENNFALLSNKINSDDTLALPEPISPPAEEYSVIYANTTKSELLTKLENWYGEKLSNYNNYLEDVIWCNDKKYNASTKNFAAYDRYKAYSPSLVCPNDSLGGKLSKYTVFDTTYGNGAFLYPIGLLTADELMFAGAGSSSNTSFYLYVNSSSWWTSSPSMYDGTYYNTFTYATELSQYGDAYPSAYLRPSIAIKSTAIVSGTGTKTNPYIILAV